MIVMAIDPGARGGYAVFDSGELIEAGYMPSIGRTHGKGKMVDGHALNTIIAQTFPEILVIEQINAMPGQGVTSMFHMGEGFGIIRGITIGLGVTWVTVLPQVWKKKMGLIKKDKSASRALAKDLYPDFAENFRLVKDDGVAEAVLIGHNYLNPF